MGRPIPSRSHRYWYVYFRLNCEFPTYGTIDLIREAFLWLLPIWSCLLYCKVCNIMYLMTHEQMKAGRLKTALTQVQAALRLGVSQPYLSQLEKGERPITSELARSAT